MSKLRRTLPDDLSTLTPEEREAIAEFAEENERLLWCKERLVYCYEDWMFKADHACLDEKARQAVEEFVMHGTNYLEHHRTCDRALFGISYAKAYELLHPEHRNA